MMTETSITVSPSEGAPNVKTDPGAGPSQTWIQLNVDFFKTLPGLIKILVLLIAIICMACASPARGAATNWFLFVVVICFISSVMWFFIYLFSLKEKLQAIPKYWKLLFELLNSGSATILYITAFITQLAFWSPRYAYYYRASNLTAGVFGLFNTIAYGIDTYFLYVEWKSTGNTNNP